MTGSKPLSVNSVQANTNITWQGSNKYLKENKKFIMPHHKLKMGFLHRPLYQLPRKHFWKVKWFKVTLWAYTTA